MRSTIKVVGIIVLFLMFMAIISQLAGAFLLENPIMSFSGFETIFNENTSYHFPLLGMY